MPTIKRLKGIRITMYFADHAPPHFHVIGVGFAARVTIADATILSGALPSPVSRRVTRWARANRAFLESKWAELEGD